MISLAAAFYGGLLLGILLGFLIITLLAMTRSGGPGSGENP